MSKDFFEFLIDRFRVFNPNWNFNAFISLCLHTQKRCGQTLSGFIYSFKANGKINFFRGQANVSTKLNELIAS